jgi:hypothetical protein
LLTFFFTQISVAQQPHDNLEDDMSALTPTQVRFLIDNYSKIYFNSIYTL